MRFALPLWLQRLGAALLLALGCAVHAQPIADPGTEGFSVVTGGGEVFATYLGNSASYSNDLYFNGRFIFNNHQTPVGTRVSLGTFPAGTELIFELRVQNTGYTFFTGPASRNPDGYPHARAQKNWNAAGVTLVSFEDLYAGPFAYNDLSFSFSNTGTTPVPPPPPLVCDADRDGDVDRDDIGIITAARNQPADGPLDPRDPDRNGVINVLDARLCTARCTRASCETGVPNVAPVANAGSALTGEVGLTVTLDGRASSDANNDPLSFAWVLVNAPAGGGVSLANAGTARPTFVPLIAGLYTFSLVVSDGRASSAPSSVAVQVVPRQVAIPDVVGRTRDEAVASLRAVGLNLGAIQSVTSPATAVGTVLAQSPQAGLRVPAGTAVGLSLSIGNQVVIPTLTNLTPAAAQAALQAAGFVVGNTSGANSPSVAPGLVVGTLPAAGGGAPAGSVIDLLVSVGPDQTPPQAQITSPNGLNALTGRVQVQGLAFDANLRSWVLEVAAVGDTNWQRLGGGTSSVNGVLGVLDTMALGPDFYRLRLTVDDGSFSRSTFVDVRVEALVQPGRFELVYTDLKLPNPGLPLTLLRTYDSAVQSSGAFGRGWRLAMTDTSVREDANKNVYITLPDGRRSAFGFTPTPVSPFFPGSVPGYTAGPGVHDKLEALGACGLVVQSGGTWFCFPGEAYDPDTYLLTTREGRKYTVSQTKGIQKIEDAAGGTLTISDAGILSSNGRSVRFERDANGLITAVVDPNGSRLTYRYDTSGRLVAAVDATGQATSYEYVGSSSLISAIILPGGCQPLRNTYDSTGKLASIVDGNGQRTTFTYSDDGLTKWTTDPLGRSTVLVTDTRGNVLTESYPNQRLVSRTWDAANNLTSVTTSDGLRTEYRYDSQGRWTTARRVRSDGVALEFLREFNASGNLLRYTTPTGAGLVFTYDDRQHPVRTDVLGDGGALLRSVAYVYDEAGRLLSTDAAGGVWNYSYDGLGNLLSMRPPDGNTTLYTYDTNGMPLTATAPDGTVTRLTYDAGGRVTSVSRNGVLLKQTSYDSESRPTVVTEAEGGSTRFGYSCLGQLTSVTDAAGAITRYRYDAANRLADVLLPDGQSRSFSWSAGSLLANRRDADGGNTVYGHTTDGLLESMATPNLPAGQASFLYDNLRQLVGVTHPDFQIRSTLDALGRVTSSVEGPANAPRTLSVSYGVQGQPERVNENGREILSGYNAQGDRSYVVSPDGRRTDYVYDAMRRLVSVVTDGGGSVSFQYDTSNRRVRTLYGNGASTAYTWDGDQLRSSVLTDGSGAVIQRYDYGLSPNGYRRSTVIADGRIDYGYDALWRLTSETRQSSSLGNAISQFSYDVSGNRIDAGLLASGHRLVKQGNDAYGYDANGNVTSIGAETFSYDSNNRLTGYSRPGVTASYAYDGRGRRVRKTVGSDTRAYLWDGRQLLAEYDGSGALVQRYSHGLGPDEVLMLHRGSDTYYYHTDPQGSIVAISNAAGQVVQRYDYDAWGTVLRATGPFAYAGNGLVNTRTFLGREIDAESGLYQLRARAYDTRTGRFLQKDPQQGNLSDPRSQHPYAYALNSPLHYSDASGEVAAIEYAFLLKPGKWNSAGALIGFMHGFITPTFSFLGEFLGELNRAGPDTGIESIIAAAFQNAESAVQNIEDQIVRIGKIGDPYTFAGSYATGLNWNVGFEIKIKKELVPPGAGVLGIPKKCSVSFEIIPAQGGFKSGVEQGFNYLRQVLHLPEPTPPDSDRLKVGCS